MKDLMPFRPTNFRVGITQMLAARDERVIRQRIWLNRHGSSLISFCINMPGEIKDNTESHQIHLAGIDAVNRLLKQQGWPVRAQASWRLVTGPEAFWSVAIPPEELKKALIILEQQHPLGRGRDVRHTFGDTGRSEDHRWVLHPGKKRFLPDRQSEGLDAGRQ